MPDSHVCPEGQALPQRPQLSESFCVSAQRSPQGVRDGGHMSSSFTSPGFMPPPSEVIGASVTSGMSNTGAVSITGAVSTTGGVSITGAVSITGGTSGVAPVSSGVASGASALGTSALVASAPASTEPSFVTSGVSPSGDGVTGRSS